MKKRQYAIDINGETITAIFSDLVKQANGSVILSCKNTTVLATTTMSDSESTANYFDLKVEYVEKFYASGEILGIRFQKREGKETTKAIISARVIDRTLRPLFDKNIKNSIHVGITVLSLGDYDPTILGVNAASIALCTSDIPFNGPVSGALILKENPESTPKINTRRDKESYYADIIVCGTSSDINMIEASSKEIPNSEILDAIKEAQKYIEQIESWQKELLEKEGKNKIKLENKEIDPQIIDLYEKHIKSRVETEIIGSNSSQKIKELEKIFVETIKENTDNYEEIEKDAVKYFNHQIDILVHKLALEENKRVDGRQMDEIRDIYAEIDFIKGNTHGSAVFYRGDTHVLSVVTLAGPEDMLVEEGIEVKQEKRFYHHYNFPPYSVGDAGRLLAPPKRRSIGHGILAEKAVRPLIPDEDKFPYTIRVVSECMSSNGSTSQASICAMSLALFDAGVPMERHVAGIAMGVIISEDGEKYKILTDIQGPEDHHGDMDFKIAGTRKGVTAMQLDIKVKGLKIDIIEEALNQGEKARNYILDKMEEVINSPRKSVSPKAPVISVINIDKELIGLAIGSGGETIKRIQTETDTNINISEEGKVYIIGKNREQVEKAENKIKSVTKIWSIGETTTGIVKKILDNIGIIVELPGGKDGLVHISELATFHVKNISDIVKEGDEVPVTIISIDKELGRIGLSIKKDSPDFFKNKNN